MCRLCAHEIAIGNNHDSVLAVPRHDLRPVMKRPFDDLAEASFSILKLPSVHWVRPVIRDNSGQKVTLFSSMNLSILNGVFEIFGERLTPIIGNGRLAPQVQQTEIEVSLRPAASTISAATSFAVSCSRGGQGPQSCRPCILLPIGQIAWIIPNRKAVVSPNSSHAFSASIDPISCQWASRNRFACP